MEQAAAAFLEVAHMFPMGFRFPTRRLLIRRMVPDDWQDLYEYLSDPAVVRYEPYGVYTRADAMLEAANRANCASFLAVCLLTSGKMIGNLYVARMDEGYYELGYVFNRRYHGKNYAYESCRAILDCLFTQMGAVKVVAHCDARNLRSMHLMERLGMTEEERYMGKDFTGESSAALSCQYGIDCRRGDKISIFRPPH